MIDILFTTVNIIKQKNGSQMDIIAIDNANNAQGESCSLPKGIRAIHRKYGLWICKCCRNAAAAPRGPGDLPFRRFEFYDLSHMFEGSGWYSPSEGKVQVVEKGEGILVSPGFRHKYGGRGEPYVEDAISFHGPLADHLRDAGVIRDGVLRMGQARRLLPIIELARDNSEDSQVMANMELQKLLVELHFENKRSAASENPAFERLLEELRRSPAKPWPLDLMADFCKLSASQLNRLFKRKTGMTSKGYLDSLRMQLAAETLAGSAMAVKDLAAELGYSDPYHFSRRFKELKGYAPRRYRELFHR